MRARDRIYRESSRLVRLADDLAADGFEDFADAIYVVADEVREIADASQRPRRETETEG